MPSDISVLVVDDDHSIRRLIRTLLSRAGYESEEAQNGEEALRMIKTHAYRIILLDLMMPVVNGFEVLEWLEEHSPDSMQCVIVTTAAADRDISRLRRDAVFSVLRKPFDLAELVQTVDRCAQTNDASPDGPLTG